MRGSPTGLTVHTPRRLDLGIERSRKRRRDVRTSSEETRRPPHGMTLNRTGLVGGHIPREDVAHAESANALRLRRESQRMTPPFLCATNRRPTENTTATSLGQGVDGLRLRYAAQRLHAFPNWRGAV